MEKQRNRLVVFLIQFYRAFLSGYFGGSCRYQPSCSAYGIEAFQTHSFLRAFLLTFGRILRCHPFGSSGYDPVPSKRCAHEQR